MRTRVQRAGWLRRSAANRCSCGKTYTLDFKGGIKQRVEVNPNEPIKSVRLKVIGFRVEGLMQEGGTVTFEQNDVDVDSKSTLTLTQNFPPKFAKRDVFGFAATIEEPGHQPVTLESQEPMIVTATLTQYPANTESVRPPRNWASGRSSSGNRLGWIRQDRASSGRPWIARTPYSRKAIALAEARSEQNGSDHIDCEDLLIGLAQVGRGVASAVLADADLDLATLDATPRAITQRCTVDHIREL